MELSESFPGEPDPKMIVAGIYFVWILATNVASSQTVEQRFHVCVIMPEDYRSFESNNTAAAHFPPLSCSLLSAKSAAAAAAAAV